MSGKYFNIVPYGVDEVNNVIDYDKVRELALEHKPKLILAGASAYPRVIDFEKFAEIAKEVGAYLMVDMAHIAGLVAAGLHPNPVPYADFVTTTTHKTLRGRAAADSLQRGICKGDRQGDLPWYPGWPAHAYDCGKGGLLRGGAYRRI